MSGLLEADVGGHTRSTVPAAYESRLTGDWAAVAPAETGAAGAAEASGGVGDADVGSADIAEDSLDDVAAGSADGVDRRVQPGAALTRRSAITIATGAILTVSNRRTRPGSSPTW
jgi:hypothetical protein